MDKASRAIRRSGAKLKSLGSGGNADLNVMVSELKDMRESAKGFMNAQNSASQDMMRWAANEENRAIQDVANHIAELNLLWTDVQRDFIGHLKEYKQMYEMILEGEKHVQQAKEDLSNLEQKETKLRKDVRKAEKSVFKPKFTIFCGRSQRNTEADIRNLETKLHEAQLEREKSEIEVTERIRENEAVKMIRLKEGFVRIAEAYIELGKKCSTVFEAQKDVAMEIPDVHGRELEEVKYTGSSKTQNYLYQAKEKLHRYKRESFRLNPPLPFSSYRCKTPDEEIDDPPPYSPTKQATQQWADKSKGTETIPQVSPTVPHPYGMHPASPPQHNGMHQVSPSHSNMHQVSPPHNNSVYPIYPPQHNGMYPALPSKESLDQALDAVKFY